MNSNYFSPLIEMEEFPFSKEKRTNDVVFGNFTIEEPSKFLAKQEGNGLKRKTLDQEISEPTVQTVQDAEVISNIPSNKKKKYTPPGKRQIKCQTCCQAKNSCEFGSKKIRNGDNKKNTSCNECQTEKVKKSLARSRERFVQRKEEGTLFMKECNTCFIVKSEQDFPIGRNQCKPCILAQDNGAREKNKESNLSRVAIGRECSMCGIDKNSGYFYQNQKSKHGLTSKCKDCFIVNQQEKKIEIKKHLLSSNCVDCRKDELVGVLDIPFFLIGEYDHLPQFEKLHNVTETKKSMESIKIEMAKTEHVCPVQ